LGGYTIPGIPGAVGPAKNECNGFPTTSGSGSCWLTPPIPATYEPHTHPAGTHWCGIRPLAAGHDGCWKLTSKIPGTPGVYVAKNSQCNLSATGWIDGECWFIEPTHIPGLCDIPGSGIPCSTAEFAQVTFGPLLVEGFESLLEVSMGADFSALNKMGGALPPGL
jgi:hypothetical protein